MKLASILVCLGVALGLAIGGVLLFSSSSPPRKPVEASVKEPDRTDDPDTFTIERTDYANPKEDETFLADDRIEDKKTAFDPMLIDRRGEKGWAINASEAVIRLDVPIIKPDLNPELLVLHPSYKAAVGNQEVLPSVNLIDGKAKQFDDGLYAALDRAYCVGEGDALKGHVDLIARIFDRVESSGGAASYLAAGLVLADRKTPISSNDAVKSLVKTFLADEAASKPIGFYTWTPELSRCFRFLRYFSRPIADRKIVAELASAWKQDPALLADYRKALAFYSRLTNPLASRSLADVADKPDAPLPPNAAVSIFPPSTSRENELFARLFPLGLPRDANLMKELVLAIRSGKVNLAPRPDSGWYDHQVYALETLLLPEKGEEANKLLLTGAYKKRMLEAFQALVTKRRETHARQLPAPGAKAEAPPRLQHIRPRLRVEPNPSYYLRTARSYAFLANFLEAAVGEPTLKKLHGMREKGEREADLFAELHSMRDLFYGLYSLSCEDIGLKTSLPPDEVADLSRCETEATRWLGHWADDADLAADTRVAVPIFYDIPRKKTRLWMTIGVRLAVLDASYAKPPRIRPPGEAGAWQAVDLEQLREASYLIPVDEFAEVEINGLRVLNRDELRAVCDARKTRAAIVEALQK